MKDIKETIISSASIIGAIASIVGFVVASSLLGKINFDLLTGIVGAVAALFSTYLFFYEKNKNSKLQKEIIELQMLSESIKNSLEHKKEKTVFLSYNHRDEKYAKKIAKELEKANLKTWDFQENIKVGENWKESIEKGLRNSEYFLFIISKDALNSGYLVKELELALKQGKKILPVMIDDSVLPENISMFKYADIKENYYNGLEEILKSVKKDIEKERNEN